MAKDPKKLNPQEPFIKTWPGQVLGDKTLPLVYDLLPAVFKTNTNKKVFNAIIEDLFQPHSLESLNFTVGRKKSATNGNVFLPHPTSNRQFELGSVVFTETGVETLTAENVAQKWNFNERVNENSVPIAICDLPIDVDKFANWHDYYWIEEGMPAVNITGSTAFPINVKQDIIGSQYYTLPIQRNGRSLELKNGMRLIFQQHPSRTNISGDDHKEYTSTGASVDPIGLELTGYDKGRIGVGKDGTNQIDGVNFRVFGNEIHWITVPAVGSRVYISLPDYYLTREEYRTPRVWQVEGVGSEDGIQLLGSSHQTTATSYSKVVQGLWDQVAIPWDRIEWDGDIVGINAKHYILQKVGAENRNAHSRVNVWYHKDTIQTIVDFLQLSFNDIASDAARALRPIVEFEHTLEMWKHGTTYRPWVNGVETVNISPNFYVGKSVRTINEVLGMALPTSEDYRLNAAPRILWLVAGAYVNKIINFRSVNGIITEFFVEQANNSDVVVVQSLVGSSYAEYYWKNGQALLADYRKKRTQQPNFELYGRAGIRLSDVEASSNRAIVLSEINSTIIEIEAGDQFDSESGYNLKFSPSSFTEISSENIAKNPMYNIQYKLTQQVTPRYFSDGQRLSYPGPFSFRRIQNKSKNVELSNGWKQAWFRLKSWVISQIDISGETIIPLDVSGWSTYNWGITIDSGEIIFVHLDNFQPVVDNRAVVARGQPASFKIYLTDDVSAIVNDGNGDYEVASSGDGTLDIFVPENAGDILTITFGSTVLKVRVIDAIQDPRNVKVKLDGLYVDYSFNTTVTDNKVTAVDLLVDGQGVLEIAHQGNQFNTTDSITAIPGIELNPEQTSQISSPFSVGKLIEKLQDEIDATKRKEQSWSTCPKIKALNGIQMAANSSMRATWATIKLNPSLEELMIARSLACWKWNRRFLNKLEELHALLNFESLTLEEGVNRILEELMIGVTDSSVDAVTGMAFTTTGMNKSVTNVATSTSEFDLAIKLETSYYFGADHVYVYKNNQLLTYLIDYTFDQINNKVILTVPAVPGTEIKIYQANHFDVFTGIPASPAKLGLSEVYKPAIINETWGNNSRTYIRRHDGSTLSTYSSTVLNNLILEVETRIYNGILNVVGNRDKQLILNNHRVQELNESQTKAQAEWYKSNNVDYRDRSDFVLTDPWTWNYDGLSWRGLYLKKFGTYNLNTAPWEALSFSEKPTWWAAHYSWTDENKRNALEAALRLGITSNPAESLTINPKFRRDIVNFPVGLDGKLQDPVTGNVLVTPPADDASRPWEIGSLGPIELAWQRSPAGVWNNVLHSIGDYNKVSEFFDDNIDPYAKQLHVQNYSVQPKGLAIAPIIFFQERPIIGLGAVIFESNREFNLLGETPLDNLRAISMRPGFGLGGFSDGNILLKLPFTKEGSSSYIPSEDVLMTLSEGVPVSQLRYTSVRLQKDSNGFRVHGYDPTAQCFTIFKPNATLSGPSSQRQLSLAYGTFIEYLTWNQTPVQVQYGQLFANKQELLTFFMGLGEYQRSRGLVLEDIDDRGIIVDWKQAAIDAFGWIEENWGEGHYCIVGIATAAGLNFAHTRGMLDNLSQGLGANCRVLLASNRTIHDGELLVTRDIETHVDNISLIDDSEQIVFIDLALREYEHVVFVNKQTKFNDNIIDSTVGDRIDTLKMSGRRTYGWTGRPYASGVLPTETGLLPGFDSLVSDIVRSRHPETSTFDEFKNKLARSNAVPAKSTVISEFLQDGTNAFLYQQGVQKAAGTNLAIDALFRNSNFDIPGTAQEVNVNEHWMFDVGIFGKTVNKKIWEIELRKEDFTGRRQIIRFNEGANATDLRSDNIIDLVGPKDSRWITRPADINFRTIPRNEITVEYSKLNGWLPSAGIAELTNTDLRMFTLDDFEFTKLLSLTDIKESNNLSIATLFSTKAFGKYADYKIGDYAWNNGVLHIAKVNYASSSTGAFDSANWQNVVIDGNLLPSIWVSDYNGHGWNVLQTMLPGYIEEICPNALDTGLNESKVTFASPHGFVVGEKIIISGSGDGTIDNIHVVKEIVDDYNLLIAARTTSNQIVYNVVSFKIKSVKFNTDAEWQGSSINFLPGMKAYIDYGDTEGTWKTITYVADGPDAGYSPDTIVEYSGPMVAAGDISAVKLINLHTQEQLATLETFDPYKGLTIDEVVQYIDHRGIADPAVYNITDLGERDLEAAEGWANNEVGKLWWDLNTLRYIEYEQTDDIQYRAVHWGEKFADSKVTIFEWTESAELPTLELFPHARLDKSSGPMGQLRYSEHTIVNPVSNERTLYYYFWNGNVSETNSAAPNRPYSANGIASIINDPDSNGVAWMSPIDQNALLLSNVHDFFVNGDRLILRIEQDFSPEQNFNFSKLIAEGFTGDIIDNYFYKRLEASIAGRDNYREIYKIKPFIPGNSYTKGDYIVNFNNGAFRYLTVPGDYIKAEYPVLKLIDDQQEDVTQVWTATPNKDARIFRAAINFVAGSSIGIDRDAKRIAISGAVAMISGILESGDSEYYAVLNTRRPVPSTHLHSTRKYGNQIVPHPQSWFKNIADARRVLISTANDFLLKIDTVSKAEWDKYLRVCNLSLGRYTRDISIYWEYADYIAEGYGPGEEVVRLTDFIELLDLDDTVNNFAIIDSANNTIEAYNKDGNNITLVYRKNGTIQFKKSLWDGTLGNTWDASRWDASRWDEDGSEIIETVLKALRLSIFVGDDLGYFNLLFFALVKESLVQIPAADWVAKTTYLDVAQTSSNNLNQAKMFYNKKGKLVTNYIEEVKPYHSKILNMSHYNEKVVPTAVAIAESLQFVVTTIPEIIEVANNTGLLTEDGKIIITDIPPSAEFMINEQH